MYLYNQHSFIIFFPLHVKQRNQSEIYMKFKLSLLTLLLSANFAFSQSVIDVFYQLPAKLIDDLSTTERKKLVSEGSLIKEDMEYTIEIAKTSGFIRVNQSYTAGQSGYQRFEVCIWNYNKKQLVGFAAIGGSNGGYFQNELTFFNSSGNKLIAVQDKVFKTYSPDFNSMMDQLVTQLCKPGTTKKMKDDIKFAALTFTLPEKGKNIVLRFSDDQEYARYAKYILHRELIFTWNNNGRFE